MPDHPQTQTGKMRAFALEILENYPNGIGFNALKKLVAEKDPTFKPSAAGFVIWNLGKTSPEITRTSKNTLVLSKYAGIDTGSASPPLPGEAGLYQPFAEWLAGPSGEATEAVAVGGAGFKKKWGTPDVVGVYKAKASDLIKFPPVLVAAEIKSDPSQSIVAFGQAISYRLFSHKTFLVMPDTIEKSFNEDHERLRSLCELFGVGYILFDKVDDGNPNFQTEVRARSFEPDMFYVNLFARRLLQLKLDHFNKLFQ